MKMITIESMIDLSCAEAATAYAQVINTAVSSHSLDELREGMERLKTETDTHCYFEWGFGRCHFWLIQRKGYQSPETLDIRILIAQY